MSKKVFNFYFWIGEVNFSIIHKSVNQFINLNLKIDSKEPVRVEKVKTTGVAGLNLDAGNLAVAYD